MIKYKCIVIDPPWNQGKTGKRLVRPNQGITLEYPTMKKEELMKLPIDKGRIIIVFYGCG